MSAYDHLREDLALTERTVPFDMKVVQTHVKGIAQAIERQAKKGDPAEPLGKRLNVKRPIRVKSVKGDEILGTILVRSRVSQSPHAVLAAGTGTIGGKPGIVIDINGRYDNKYYSSASKYMLDALYQHLSHEVTHLVDVVPKERGKGSRIPSTAEVDLKKYYNTPTEVRAYMREVVDQVLKYAPKLKKSFSGERLVHYALQVSQTWKEIEPYLSKKNRNLILKNVYQALKEKGHLGEAYDHLRESLHLETGEPLWVRATYREVSKWRRENDAEDLISRYDSKSGRVIVSGAPDLKARNLLGKYLQSKGFLVAVGKKIKLRLYVKPGEKRLEKEEQPRNPSKPRVSKAEKLKGPILKAIKNHPDEGTEWTLANLEKKVGGSKALIRKAVKELEAEGQLWTRVRKRNTPAGGTGAVSSMFGGARVVVHKYLVIEPVIRESTEADTARQVASLKKIIGKRGTRAVTAFKDWRKGAFVLPKRV